MHNIQIAATPVHIATCEGTIIFECIPNQFQEFLDIHCEMRVCVGVMCVCVCVWMCALGLFRLIFVYFPQSQYWRSTQCYRIGQAIQFTYIRTKYDWCIWSRQSTESNTQRHSNTTIVIILYKYTLFCWLLLLHIFFFLVLRFLCVLYAPSFINRFLFICLLQTNACFAYDTYTHTHTTQRTRDIRLIHVVTVKFHFACYRFKDREPFMVYLKCMPN